MGQTDVVEEAETGGAGSSHRDGWIRPRRDRLVAGVAVGLAKKSGLPLWLVRTGLVAAAILGGGGLAAYLLAWIVMRGEGKPESILDSWLGTINRAETTSAKTRVAVLAVAGVIFFGALGVFSAPLIASGFLLIVGFRLLGRG